MKLITLNLPERYIDGLEALVRDDIYPNRSEAIRLAVRDFLKKESGGLMGSSIKQEQTPFRWVV